jgi:preprotein translocase subunit SecB
MKPSPLILKGYAVLDLQMSANLQFNPQAPVELSMEDYKVNVDVAPSTRPKDSQWQVVLQVQHVANPKRNHTFAFSLRMIGFLDVHPSFAEDKRDNLLRVNGASMLYGAAREIIRSTTAHGPYLPVLLPSVSFYPQKEPTAKVAEESPKPGA